MKRHRSRRVKFWVIAAVLCILVTLASFAVTWFIRSFSSYDPQYYAPSGPQREELLQRQQEEQQER